MIVTTGLTEIINNGFENFDFMAVGTGTAAKSLTDTALEAEVERRAVDAVTIQDNTIVLESLFTNAEAIATLEELGILDANSGGNLLISELFANSIIKTAQEGLLVAIEVTLENG